MIPKEGDRVRMTGIMPNDPAPMEVGAEGTVRYINVAGQHTQIDVEWDNGRSLMLLPGDPFTITRRAEEAP